MTSASTFSKNTSRCRLRGFDRRFRRRRRRRLRVGRASPRHGASNGTGGVVWHGRSRPVEQLALVLRRRSRGSARPSFLAGEGGGGGCGRLRRKPTPS